MSTTLAERKEWLAKHGKSSVSWQELDAVVDVITEGVADAFEKHLTARRALEQRVAALEGKPHVKFTGVWKAGAYQPGDAATHHGGLWVCMSATSGEPAKDFAGWQLAVKRGAAQ